MASGTESIMLHDTDYVPNRPILMLEALSLTLRGEVEGVGGNGLTKVRYLRELPESERPNCVKSIEDFNHDTKSTVVARTNIGAFKEEVVSIRGLGVLDSRGIPMVERQVIGHVWTHCTHRNGFRALELSNISIDVDGRRMEAAPILFSRRSRMKSLSSGSTRKKDDLS